MAARAKTSRTARPALTAGLMAGALLVLPVFAGAPQAAFAQSGDIRVPPPAPDLRPSTGWTPIAPSAPKNNPAGQLPANTTVIPRTLTEPSPGAGASQTTGQVTLLALLTADGQGIDQGLVWRVFRDSPTADAGAKPVATNKEANPTLRLEPGDYIVNAAFGRAYLSRKVNVAPGQQKVERFVLNAGGLRLIPVLANNEPLPERSVIFDIFSDERDQFGNRIKVMSGAKPNLIIRLNAGIYNVVSTYGDANAVARTDLTVEAGKLTEATLVHSGSRITFKLVTRQGGEAIADTQWSVLTAQGELVKESVGALPTHILAAGSYIVSAKHSGQVFRRDFIVKAGEVAQVEVVMQ